MATLNLKSTYPPEQEDREEEEEEEAEQGEDQWSDALDHLPTPPATPPVATTTNPHAAALHHRARTMVSPMQPLPPSPPTSSSPNPSLPSSGATAASPANIPLSPQAMPMEVVEEPLNRGDEEEKEEKPETDDNHGQCHSPVVIKQEDRSTLQSLSPPDVSLPTTQPLDNGEEQENEDSDDEASARKKHKTLSSLPDAAATDAAADAPIPTSTPAGAVVKKPKKKNNNVWTKSTSRKGKKKGKSASAHAVAPEDTVLITPIPRFPDKSDDSPDAVICLSRAYKAEKVELSEDRLTAGSTKGYRMVRATRGVNEGAWYFEIKVVQLAETGHTRLGWTTEKGDLQAPVGYDGNSFGYRDIDGSKVHKALREKYGDEGYHEGDVIGFYINLPDGHLYAPQPPHLVWYKGQRYMYPADGKDEPLKVVPGSEISFFKNGVCQGVAFTDLFGGRYYPAASMYTLPNQPNCEVRFNFGPDFEFFPQDFSSRPTPRPMIEVAYHGYDGRVYGPAENGLPEK